MAEYCLGHIISRERNFLKYYDHQKNSEWVPVTYRPLSSLVLLITLIVTIGHLCKTTHNEGGRDLGFGKHWQRGCKEVVTVWGQSVWIQENG